MGAQLVQLRIKGKARRRLPIYQPPSPLRQIALWFRLQPTRLMHRLAMRGVLPSLPGEPPKLWHLARRFAPSYRRDYVEGYGTSPVSDVVGLLTYRYLKLFCCPLELTPAMKALSSFPAVQRFEQEHCFIDHFIRNEQLEQDLLAALTSAAVRMPEENVRKFRSAPRTNVSSRNRRTGHYYDAASRQLVLEREQLMIDRFGYRPPALETEAAAGGTAAAQPQAASS